MPRQFMRIVLALALGASCIPLPQAHGADAADGLVASPEPGWPQWRGIRRDGITAEKGLLQAWPAEGPKLLWKVTGLGRGWSSPIVVKGTIYVTGDVGDDLTIFAFDADGKPKWKSSNGRSWKGSYPGARACCAYWRGRLYQMNAHGRVACLDADTGKEQWAVNVLERFAGRNITWALSECLLVDGNSVYVTPGGAKALMAALDTSDGGTQWTTPPLEDDFASYSSPILFRFGGRKLLANSSAFHGFGVDADTGKLQWCFDQRNRFQVTVSGPVYADGKIFYVAPDGPAGTQYALRAEGQTISATREWKSDVDTLCGGGLLLDGVLYAAEYRKYKVWWCVDWKTGKTLSKLPELYSGSAVYGDGRLHVQAEDGFAALLGPTPDGAKIVSKFRLVESKKDAWAHPVLLDGRLYLRYHDTMWCFDVHRQ